MFSVALTNLYLNRKDQLQLHGQILPHSPFHAVIAKEKLVSTEVIAAHSVDTQLNRFQVTATYNLK